MIELFDHKLLLIIVIMKHFGDVFTTLIVPDATEPLSSIREIDKVVVLLIMVLRMRREGNLVELAN